MSSENQSYNSSVKTPNIEMSGGAHISPNRVNINDLLEKVRKKENKEKKENIVFLGLVGSIVVITGVIASL